MMIHKCSQTCSE